MPRAKYATRYKHFPQVIAHIQSGEQIKACDAGGMDWDSHHANYLGFKKHFLTDPEFERVLAERLKHNVVRAKR